ncbi:TIR domain-containing protein [Chitinophaga skermanii]|uniref:TIR domain-containing protein n=1 Tax=Chitinophaga skermanii TaxID=331697 RepID=A0A327Q1X7_9BACT|nr:toll/interleukin-1 receptor domain-containing protein [Chitinophaga skermanii]RAI97721.1 TIR domain-containing protein [Chitinophaga skermanii]
MTDDLIVEQMAEEFFRDNIFLYGHSFSSSSVLESLKRKLFDFYHPETKAIFLKRFDELLKQSLLNHRIKNHNGQPDKNCGIDKESEKLIFYIKQELSVLPTIVTQKYQSENETIRSKVFVSYSHRDKDFLLDIKRHFKPFLNNIEFWDDSQIIPGQKWKEEIQKAISETKIAILLISTDFLGSDFINTNELPPLLEAAEKKGAVIISMILRPCLFEEFETLNQYQAMNSPDNPISKMNSEDKEDLLVNLVRQVKKILN